MINRNYLKITADTSTSLKAQESKFKDSIYDLQLKQYRQPASFYLSQTEDGYELISNHLKDGKREIQQPRDGIYTYVIVSENNEPKLRISEGSHYYLASKRNEVYAAGDIEFKNRNIIWINDKSGTYNIENMRRKLAEDLQAKKITIEEFEINLHELNHRYLPSRIKVMDEVNLPFEFYIKYTNTEKAQVQELPQILPQTQPISKTPSYNEQMFGLFSMRNIALGTATVAASTMAIMKFTS